MNAEQLLKELTIRFNTDPKRYEKQDYGVLIKLLDLLVSSQSNINNISSLVTGDIKFKIEEDDLYYTLNGEDWKDLGSIKGEDGQAGITPHIDEGTGHWFIGDQDTAFNAVTDKYEIDNTDGFWCVNGVKTQMRAIPEITMDDTPYMHWKINGYNTQVPAKGATGPAGADGKDGTEIIVLEPDKVIDINNTEDIEHFKEYNDLEYDTVYIANIARPKKSPFLGIMQITEKQLNVQSLKGALFGDNDHIYHCIFKFDEDTSNFNDQITSYLGSGTFSHGDCAICIDPYGNWNPRVYYYNGQAWVDYDTWENGDSDNIPTPIE